MARSQGTALATRKFWGLVRWHRLDYIVGENFKAANCDLLPRRLTIAGWSLG